MNFVKSLALIFMLAGVSLASANVFTLLDDIRKELEAVYAKIDKATEDKDVKTLESLLAEDYEKVADGKTLKRDETVARMKKSFEIVKDIESSKTKIDKIEQVEGNQIVDYTTVAKVTITDEDEKDKSMTVTSKGRDWWVKNEDGEWICVSSERLD